MAHIAPVSLPKMVSFQQDDGTMRTKCECPIMRWLMDDAWMLDTIGEVIQEFSEHLVAAGVPVQRTFATIGQLHPRYMGTAFFWNRGDLDVRERQGEHSLITTPQYQDSPIRVMFEEKRAFLRYTLESKDMDQIPFPVLQERKEAGDTDYLAIHMPFRQHKRNLISFTTDRPGGFTDEEVGRFFLFQPLLARVLETHSLRATAVNVLDTYVGHKAGERILSGSITRGSSETIEAAIWACDIQGFTRISNEEDADTVLGILNTFFEIMGEAVADHGGEVLKFMGDGMLAMFPILGDTVGTDDDVSCRAYTAAKQAETAMEVWNAERATQGLRPVRYGLGLHIGDVKYGNIGSRDRLDFTAIGPAVNLTTRIEGLAHQMHYSVVMSKAFADRCPQNAVRLGVYDVKGFDEPVTVYVPERVAEPELEMVAMG